MIVVGVPPGPRDMKARYCRCHWSMQVRIVERNVKIRTNCSFSTFLNASGKKLKVLVKVMSVLFRFLELINVGEVELSEFLGFAGLFVKPAGHFAANTCSVSGGQERCALPASQSAPDTNSATQTRRARKPHSFKPQ